MENNDHSHSRHCDDQPKGTHVNGQGNASVDQCMTSSSQELVAAPPRPSSEDDFQLEFPLGFRFAPTDEDLILYYLKPKIAGDPIPLADFFADVDLYRFDPRELIESHKAAGKGEDEWYFFTPRDRKYPNGSRPNRRTPGGFWKAITKDSVIQMENMTIGYKRLLAFSRGASPRRGDGTALSMHEYRLAEDEKRNRTGTDEKKGAKDKRLDEWVLCKVFTPKHAKHSKNGRKSDHPLKTRNEQNHDQPDGNGDDAPTTAGKNRGRTKGIVVDEDDGYLQDLQSTPTHKLNMGRQVDVADNYQLPQSSQISALGGLETDRPAYNVLPYSSHTDPDSMAHCPSEMQISVHLQVQRVATQPASLGPPTGNAPPESHPSRSCRLPAHSTRHNPRPVAVHSFKDLISTNP
ncbi:hypothetical protein ACJRO7_012889 [Eucalyptus globulus]|uniref:NAC domain-containing protein n=1 Tax=Eucalyptus globulus TaxID=34317 RepID=A0ABD3LK77_EUCGL